MPHLIPAYFILTCNMGGPIIHELAHGSKQMQLSKLSDTFDSPDTALLMNCKTFFQKLRQEQERKQCETAA